MYLALLPLTMRPVRASLFTAAAFFVALAPGSTAVAQSTREAAPTLPQVLTLTQALEIFRQRGFDLLVAEASVRSAEGDLKIAGGVANPGVSGTVGKNFDCGSTTDCSTLSWSVGLQDNNLISTFVTGKYGLRKDVAGAALAAARKSRDDAQRNLEFQVKQAYITALQAQALLQNAVETRDSNLSTRKLNERRFQLGAINEGDLARIQVAALESEQAVAQAEQNLRVAKVSVAFLLGFRTLVPDFQTDEKELEFSVPKGLGDASRESVLQDALKRRPDLAALVQQEKRADAALSLAKREIIPDFTFSVLYSANGTGNTAISPPNLSFGLALNLPIFYFQSGEIEKAEADFTTQQVLREKAEATVVSDVETAWAGLVAARQLVERMESTLLERAKQARDITQIQYEKGAASLLDLLDAQRQYTATRAEYAQDLANYWIAVAQLEQAMAGTLRS
jgi:outer membrane protein, heavy metal efflux system